MQKCVQSKMARYDQYHTTPSQTATLKSMGVPIAPYDGAAEFYFRNMEDLISVITDSEYGQVSLFALPVAARKGKFRQLSAVCSTRPC